MQKKLLNTNHPLLTARGFSTLFIVIILGVTALALVLLLSTSSAWSIGSSINIKNSSKALALVDACAEVALDVMRQNNSYVGTGSVVLDGNTCTYVVTNTGGSTRNINVSGVVDDITRKLNINTSSFGPIVISSWQEV